ncbi:MAG: peptidoglycan-binding protein [Candidatus Pacebacteria bacterium]|nr:peptidoglycan-binding protein [Candidatus Paceibacterota bacterium]
MKKIICTSFLVFVFLFSYGGIALAESNTEASVLQSIANQIESIRIQLGGLVANQTTTQTTVSVPPESSTGLTYCTGTVVNSICVGDIVTEIECNNHPTDCPSWTIMSRTASPINPSVNVVIDMATSDSIETLRPGARGDRVLSIQKFLQSNGFYSGTLDGIYGRGMSAAVSAFQQSKGLVADGILGPKTLVAFYGTSWSKDIPGVNAIAKPDVVNKLTTLDKPVNISVLAISGWYNGKCVKGEFRPDGTWTVYQLANGCTDASPIFLQ